MEDHKLLTYIQAARALTLSPFTLRRLVSKKKIGFTKLGSKAVRFTSEQLQAFIEAGRREPAE